MHHIPVAPVGKNTSTCRSCGSPLLSTFLRLGTLPLSGHLIKEEDKAKPEPRYPLDVAFCHACTLVQILYTVPPAELFQTDYPYFSSVSDALLRHSKANVEALCASRKLGPESLVVELASNDGYLLQYFVEKGIPVLGIDPAQGPAAKAVAKGVPTLNEFFTWDVAEQLVDAGTQADVIIGNNVLAHVADTNGFVAGVAWLLKETGVAVFEFPHLMELIDRCEFDTIYHEHQCYFSLMSVQKLFARHGMTVQHVERLPIHGGSLRIHVVKGHREPWESVTTLLAEEESRGMSFLAFYEDFASRVARVRDRLVAWLIGQKKAGNRVVAYGAAAKGGTLLNYCGISPDLLKYAVDRSPAKQGRYMAGSRLPIFPVEMLLAEQPDSALLLVWNFKDEVLAQQAEYRKRGGKFVLPVNLTIL